MPTDKERTACCGLYCGDCIPSNRALFDAAQEFREELEKCRFGEYAQYKSKGDKSFDRYGTLQEVLSAILSLQCSKTCFHGGGRSDCPTRACVRGKGMEGCWQCTGFETCSLLEPMSACHGDTVKHNLRMIRQFGVEDWADAQLETAKPTEISHCGNCRECVEHCPARAVTGESWQPGMVREHIYDATACFRMARTLAGRNGIKATICGLCINVCPWTQRYLARRLKEAGASIAPVSVEDLDTVRKLFREYEASLPFDLSFQDFEGELAGLPGRYSPPTGRILLATCADESVGCVALRQIGDEVCEMKRLFVRPAFRGQGIGQALAEAIIEEARRIGYKRMRLDTVLEPAKSLYRSRGFREIPPYQHVPIEGVVFMELEL